jgi:hypothetical protein
MRKLTPVDLQPWALPLVVLALVLPIVVATLLVGSVGAFITGALVATTVIVIAARTRFDEPIEAPAATDRRYHLLVVALEPVEEPATAEAVAEAAGRGSGAIGADPSQEAEVLVVVPATIGRLDRWASDVGGAREAAQRRLAVSMATLVAAGLDAHGQVGDPDPVQAVEDALRDRPAHEVIFVTSEDAGKGEVREVRRRLDRPVARLAGAQRSAREPSRRN